jgi:hypothetical protein
MMALFFSSTHEEEGAKFPSGCVSVLRSTSGKRMENGGRRTTFVIRSSQVSSSQEA